MAMVALQGPWAVARAKEPLTLCTMSINSTEEEQVMSKYMNEKTGFQKVNLIDFATPPNGKEATAAWEHGGWFKNACKQLKEKQINCDVLLISAHFANSFMGASGLKLPMNELEAARCRGDCDAILGGKDKTQGPAEAFLMGCNTMASKDPFSRTREGYRTALQKDHYPDAIIEWLLELRYGAIGKSYKERMSEAFAWVPHIYGFCDVAPAGNSVESSLDQYFKKTGDYYEHVSQIQLMKGLGTAGKSVKFCNGKLACSLQETNFKECSGSSLSAAALASDSDEPSSKQILCRLLNDQNKLADRIKAAGDLGGQSDLLDFIPNLDVFFRSHPRSSLNSTGQKLMDDARSKIEAGLKRLLKKFGTPDHQAEVVQLLVGRSIITSDAAKRILSGAPKSVQPPADDGSNN